MKELTCAYCGVTKKEISFMIGASLKPEWCMHEGTGKVSCPDCHPKGATEAEKVLRNQRR